MRDGIQMLMDMIKKDYSRKYFDNPIRRMNKGSLRNRNRLKELLKHVKGGRLFEIGCARGEFLDSASSFFDVYGMDISGYAIDIAQKRFKGRVSEGDINKKNLKESYYDAIAGFNVLEHISDPGKVISKTYSSLRPRGIFIGSCPNKSGLVGRAFTEFSNLVDRTHCSTLKPSEWRRIFEESGFREIKFFGEVMLPGGFAIYIKSRLWKHFSMNLVFICRK